MSYCDLQYTARKFGVKYTVVTRQPLQTLLPQKIVSVVRAVSLNQRPWQERIVILTEKLDLPIVLLRNFI